MEASYPRANNPSVTIFLQKLSLRLQILFFSAILQKLQLNITTVEEKFASGLPLAAQVSILFLAPLCNLCFPVASKTLGNNIVIM